MTDIVERLRHPNVDYDCKEEAADEIERLRVENTAGEAREDTLRNERDAAVAEIERLRVRLDQFLSGAFV